MITAARRVGMTVTDVVIVYVEDDPLSRQVMQLTAEHVLRIKNLIIFEDSTDIVPRIRLLNKRPDIIFLDIQVRPHDGYEMIDMIRHDPELREAKVVAITASVVNAIEKLRASGFDGMINKPVNPTLLLGLIERIVQGEQIWEDE
jgi:CheY-like chemotaxis protein